MNAALLTAPATTPAATPTATPGNRPARSSACRVMSNELAFVSATSMDVDGEVRAMIRPKAPNYVLRRLLVGGAALATMFLAVTLSVAAVSGVLASLSGSTVSAAPASAADIADAALVPSVHVARPGDTMWSIADNYRGGVDRGRYIDALIRLNGGTAIEAGAAVRLP